MWFSFGFKNEPDGQHLYTFKTNDSVTSSQTYPNLFSQHSNFLTSFGNKITYSDSFGCELDGFICSRNANQFSLKRFVYSSGRQSDCPSISIPAFFTSVISFKLNGIQCTGSFSFAASNYPNLQLLDLSRNGLTGSFLQNNFAVLFPSIKIMILDSNDFSSFTTAFQNIPASLQTLSMDYSRISKVSFASNTASGLKNLSICFNNDNEDWPKVDILALPAGLVSLNVTSRKGVIINQNYTSWDLSGLTNLVSLDVKNAVFNSSLILSFPMSLRTLKFGICYSSQSFVPANLNQLNNLQVLWTRLGGSYCTQNYWSFSSSSQSLATMTNLRELYIYNSDVDFSFTWLPSNLERLSFSGVETLSKSIYSLDLQRFTNLNYLYFYYSNFPVVGIQFTFPPSIRELHIDHCNLQDVNGLGTASSSLEFLKLYSMNLFYSTSLKNIIFAKLSKVYLYGLNLDTIPNSFSSLSPKVSVIRFDEMYKPTLPIQFELKDVIMGDNIRVLTMVNSYFLSLPRFGINSRLIHLHLRKIKGTYFMGLDELMAALPPDLKVRLWIHFKFLIQFSPSLQVSVTLAVRSFLRF
jgi:hypothetical protein